MKYYLEEQTVDLRAVFEDEVLSWPRVATKKMFGCPCYQANDRLFAFLVTQGVVITHLDETDKERLYSQHETTTFPAGKNVVQKWVEVKTQDRGIWSESCPLREMATIPSFERP
ncbi:MAG: hypothetical protein ACE5HJ_06275 [Thermoplasmata archaeon]